MLNDHEVPKAEGELLKELPEIATVTQLMIIENYFAIKRQVEELFDTEI